MKLFIVLVISILAIAAGVTVGELIRPSNTQEKATPCTDTVYVPWRDTVYIDRSRPINKPWYSYEIETTGDPEDSIYLYSGRELIKALSREQATVFAIDSLIVLDNL